MAMTAIRFFLLILQCANGPISVAKSLEAQKKRSHAMAKKNMRLLDQNSNTSENPWSVEVYLKVLLSHRLNKN